MLKKEILEQDKETMNLEYELICDFNKLKHELGLTQQQMADEDDSRYPIQDWMRNKDVISYLGLWETSIMKNSNVSNSTHLEMKRVVISLKYLHKNG